MKVLRWALLVVVGCIFGTSAAFCESITTKDYWVLDANYSEEFTNNTELKITYGQQTFILGDVYDIDWPGSSGTTDQFFDYDSGKLLYYGAKYVDSFGTWTYVPTTGQEFLPATIEVDKTYTFSWSRREYQNGVSVGNGSDSYTIKVSGPQTITVPAGTFTTYVFSLINNWKTSSGSSGTTTYTYYLAKDFGWVRLIRGGVTYERTSSPLPSAPTLTITTEGTTANINWTAADYATGYYFLFENSSPGIACPGSLGGKIDVGNMTGAPVPLYEGACFCVGIQGYNSAGKGPISNIESLYINSSSTLSVNPTSLSLQVDRIGTCTISGGTPSYTAMSDNTSVATAMVDGKTLSVTAISEGSASVTVTDGASATATVSVTVSGYTNSLGMSFVLLPKENETFIMGSPSDESGRQGDETQHQVTLTKLFYMQTTEVTQEQWVAVMGSNPSHHIPNCPKCPVEQVSWKDVQDFIAKMNQRGGGTYRLPTEAEWEYAARSGSTTAFYNGGIEELYCGDDTNLIAIGWYCYNSLLMQPIGTHEVGSKAPNSYGIYDMSGNVWEWCSDRYGAYPEGPVEDPMGSETGLLRVMRGGSWHDFARSCRSANRGYFIPEGKSIGIGFRLVREVD